jgi:hypothetical protein
MPKYKVDGEMRVEYSLEVEAEDIEEARDRVNGIFTVDIVEDGITCNDVSILNHDIEDVESIAQEKWDGMDKSERIATMKEAGASDDCAYYLADREEIPEEYEELFS